MQALRLVNTSELTRQDWLKERMKGIGGSDAAAIAGVSRWKSPVAVWLEKTGQVEPEEAGEAAYWGTVLEEIVAREFSNRTGFRVRRCNYMLQHPEHLFMLANIDREIVGHKVGLECKTTSVFNRDEWDGDNVPDVYYIQCQHYMAVTGYSGWWIACLIGGNQFVHKMVERNQEFINRLVGVEKDFWQKVIDGIIPEVDGSESSNEALKRLYPKSIDNEIVLPDTAELWIKQYECASVDEKAAKKRKQEAQNVLQQMLGNNERGHAGDRMVSWKTTIRKSYVVSETSYRKFSVK